MRSFGVLVLPLLALACGGQVSSPLNSSSNDDSNTYDETPQQRTPDGSYDLTFAEVTATASFAGELPDVAPASRGKSAVLQIDVGANSTVLTPRWGTPAPFIGTLDGVKMSLASGNATFSDDTSFYVTDTWTSIVISRASGGDLSDTFTATGAEEIVEGDEIFEATLVGRGTIAPDSTPPDVRLGALPSYGPLPWETIPVQFAEPMPALPRSILSLTPATADGIVSFDSMSLQGSVLASNWNAPSVTVVAAPFTDFALHSVEGKTFPVTFFDAGTPQPLFSFDSAGAVPAKWDDSALVSFLFADASCESGGCAKIGPIGDHGCTIPNSGLAGILAHDSSHASTVFVRYRILVGVDPSSGGGSASITPDSSVFSVETANPGQAPSTQSFGFQLSDLQTISSTFGMTQATPWTTASISMPAASELGFGVRFGSNFYCGGPIFNENSTIVLIDSITID